MRSIMPAAIDIARDYSLVGDDTYLFPIFYSDNAVSASHRFHSLNVCLDFVINARHRSRHLWMGVPRRFVPWTVKKGRDPYQVAPIVAPSSMPSGEDPPQPRSHGQIRPPARLVPSSDGPIARCQKMRWRTFYAETTRIPHQELRGLFEFHWRRGTHDRPASSGHRGTTPT
jgi:hypothetical protein